MKTAPLIVIIAMWLTGYPLYPADYEIIKDLSPTHQAKVFRQLKVVQEIPFDFSDTGFLAQPTSITSDEKGNIYIFDGRLISILSFNKTGKFRFRFSRKGEGPGEMASGMGKGGWYDIRKINYNKRLGLMVNGFRNKWINVFDSNGKLKSEIPLLESKLFYPVIDSKNNLYTLSSDKGVVQVLDKESKLVDTMLTSKELRRFFEFHPVYPWMIESLARTDNDRVFYDRLSRGRFLIYIATSSMVYVFKNQSLTDQYPIRPKGALREREAKIKSMAETKKTKKWKEFIKKFPDAEKKTLDYHYLFRELFVDKDSRDSYFLASYRPLDKRQNRLYHFTTDGKMIEVLYFNPPNSKREYCFFREKRNQKFYGIGERKIFICKR